MENSTENREFLRASLNVLVNAKSRDGMRLARIEDICEGGMRFMRSASDAPLYPGYLKLEFSIPDEEVPVQTCARVIRERANEKTCETAVVFTEIHHRDAERIRRYVVRRNRAELFETLHRLHLESRPN